MNCSSLPAEGYSAMRSRRFFEALVNDCLRRRWKLALWPCMIAAAALVFLPHPAAQRAESLHGIRTISVESVGNGSDAQALRQRIIERLRKSRLFEVVDDSSAADVILRGTSSIWATGTISLNPRSMSVRETNYAGFLSVELVSKSGQPLWSYLVTPSRFRMASITDDLADQIVQQLAEAVRNGTTGSASSSTAGAGAHASLHAAGATLPAPLYLRWIESSGMPITYDAVGSEAGIQQLAAGRIDFAASDMPLTDNNSPAQLHVRHFPTVVGGVVPIYNLPGLDRNLRLTPQVLAGIYSGAIRRWNDPRIREANRGAHLPDADITVIHRSDGSGTTFVWTSFLSQASSEWKASVGDGTHVSWPVGTGAQGNDGVAELVRKTQNAIGYVELIYAIQHQLNYAAVRNPAGLFIKADLASITAAAASATITSDQSLRFSILNAPDKDAYPISTFTWLLVPVQGTDPQKLTSIAEFLRWMLTSGQKQCASLGYAPLPREIAARELKAVDALK
jgi:phosphate ABC transporter phosphate-binding protein